MDTERAIADQLIAVLDGMTIDNARSALRRAERILLSQQRVLVAPVTDEMNCKSVPSSPSRG
jgi:hypothetical protein